MSWSSVMTPGKVETPQFLYSAVMTTAKPLSSLDINSKQGFLGDKFFVDASPAPRRVVINFSYVGSTMLTKLICVVVTTVAIGLGYHQYFGGNLIIFGQSCHRRFNYPFRYMATKTPYLSDHLERDLGDPFRHYHGGGCEPVMAWHLIRHGTRNPGSKVIKTMSELLPALKEEILTSHKHGKGNLCEAEVKHLAQWTSNPLPAEDSEKTLVPQGERELFGISRRFKRRFPRVYADHYHNDTFKFKYTKTERAQMSAKHFTRGIFREEQLEDIYFPEAVNADPVLRFYKGCKRWKKEVDKNPEAYQERVNFETSPVFNKMLAKLQKRLGLREPPSLDQVEIMYLSCSFESAWDPSNPSPWCNMFDEFDFQILEYRQDVEYYWIDGYGYKLTYEQACPTMEDIVKTITDKVEDPAAPSVYAYFTHSGTLLKVIARLGLFRDTIPLLGNNFDHHRHSRKWRTSVIDPFATNLAFVLYRCSHDFKVGLLFKEEPITQPHCGGKYLCPLEEFVSSMEPFTKDCDLSKYCDV